MKVTQLSNGLTLIYEKSDNDLPITSIYAFCNLGPAHEPDDMKGISHFIEHMCFKGTRKNPTPKSIFQFAKRLEPILMLIQVNVLLVILLIVIVNIHKLVFIIYQICFFTLYLIKMNSKKN